MKGDIMTFGFGNGYNNLILVSILANCFFNLLFLRSFLKVCKSLIISCLMFSPYLHYIYNIINYQDKLILFNVFIKTSQ